MVHFALRELANNRKTVLPSRGMGVGGEGGRGGGVPPDTPIPEGAPHHPRWDRWVPERSPYQPPP